jgi:hypothetical protein
MTHTLTFATAVGQADQIAKARLLIDSVRTFGGILSGSPFLVYELDPANASCDQLRSDPMEIVPLSVSVTLRGYPFAGKVSACADAERRVKNENGQLVWISPDCLVVGEPREMILSSHYDAAIRPVHIRNVGLLLGEEPNTYWQGIYTKLGGAVTDVSLETIVDQQTIRAYFNSHAFSIRASLGLMGRWLEAFIALVEDRSYQDTACADILTRIFLHQATLSALLVTELSEKRIHLLPTTYSYPYNLHTSVPDHRQVTDMCELVTFAYEDRSLDPRVVEDIQISEPLRTWLIERMDATKPE